MAGNEKRTNPARFCWYWWCNRRSKSSEKFYKHGIPCYTSCKKAKQKQIAATKQAETSLVVATPSTVLPAARVTRWSTQLAARSQAPLPPNTTYEALLTQDELAISDEPCELQQQEGSCWSPVTVACFFICSLTVWCTLTLPMFVVGLAPRRKRKQT